MIRDLSEAARKVEMETFRKHGRSRSVGRRQVKVRWDSSGSTPTKATRRSRSIVAG